MILYIIIAIFVILFCWILLAIFDNDNIINVPIEIIRNKVQDVFYDDVQDNDDNKDEIVQQTQSFKQLEKIYNNNKNPLVEIILMSGKKIYLSCGTHEYSEIIGKNEINHMRVSSYANVIFLNDKMDILWSYTDGEYYIFENMMKNKINKIQINKLYGNLDLYR